MKLDFFIDRPVFSTVLSTVIVIVGIVGLVLLPVDQYPQIVPPVVKVSYRQTYREEPEKELFFIMRKSFWTENYIQNHCEVPGSRLFISAKKANRSIRQG